jgi:hypothetical protein
MRALVICLALAALGACATPAPAPGPATAPRLTPEEIRQTCLSRMYTARSRGAVHWQIYENCLKDHS